MLIFKKQNYKKQNYKKIELNILYKIYDIIYIQDGKEY